MNLKRFVFSVFILFMVVIDLNAQDIRRIVRTGIEVLTEDDFISLNGKRVGLITNPTGVNSNLKSTIDILYDSPRVNLIALYGPEHGVRGDHDAGEMVRTRKDPVTGLPVYSLYGKFKKPAPHTLKDIDILVYDIQDIGVRSYTYISTMGKAMEAAAEAGIEFMVLDRPNPLGGIKVEGNIAEEHLFSLVGAYPIPYVYGLTPGELAKMINNEGWLKDGIKCELSVVPLKGWFRDMTFEATNLPWVPSSPHIPHAHKANYYVATGILGELGVINIGVGYTLPFEVFGTSYINPGLLVESLNKFYDDDVFFRPISYKPYYGKQKGTKQYGLQVYIKNPDKINLMSIQFKFLEVFHKTYPNVDILSECQDRHDMFDKVCGSEKVRELFFKNYSYFDIYTFLNKDVEDFQEKSKKYYLYN